VAEINLPSPGQRPWNLNPAIEAVNTEVEGLTDLVTDGRLSEDGLSTAFVEVGRATFVPKVVQRIRLDDYANLVTSKPSESPDTWDWFPAYQAAIGDASAIGTAVAIDVIGTRPTSNTLTLTGLVTLDCTTGLVKALPGFTAETEVVSLGTTQAPWRGAGNVLKVDCANQRIVGIGFARALLGGYAALSSINSKFIGVRVASWYGLTLPKIDVRMSALVAGQPVNADADSVGLMVAASDCAFGAGDISGAARGIRTTGSNNVFGGLHVWGVYRKDGVPQSAPMLVGVQDEGQGNTYVGTISDSPSLLDYDAAASLTNGGYGFANLGDGFQSKFIGCNVFVPNRVSLAGEVQPIGRLVGFYTGQGATFLACEITDQTNAAFVAGTPGRFAGPNLDACLIVGRQFTRIGGGSRPLFTRKPYFSGGVEVQITYQEANAQSASYGAASFGMTRGMFTIISNFEGQVNTSRIERVKSGTSAFRTQANSLTSWLTAADAGYCYFDTTLGKPVWWTGTGWVDAIGATV
jgi:hypothetical protein